MYNDSMKPEERMQAYRLWVGGFSFVALGSDVPRFRVFFDNYGGDDRCSSIKKWKKRKEH
jgi:hypothetical protein